MKEIKIDRNSWHFKILESNHRPFPKNMCEYVRSVMFCLFANGVLILAVIAAAALVMLMVVNFVGYILMALLHRHNPFDAAGAVVMGVIMGIYLATYLYVRIGMKIENRVNNNLHLKKEPGFMKMAYTSFKEKVCYKISIDD